MLLKKHRGVRSIVLQIICVAFKQINWVISVLKTINDVEITDEKKYLLTYVG